jgi:hypothetical protein
MFFGRKNIMAKKLFDQSIADTRIKIQAFFKIHFFDFEAFKKYY